MCEKNGMCVTVLKGFEIISRYYFSERTSKEGEAVRKAQMGTLARAPNKRQCVLMNVQLKHSLDQKRSFHLFSLKGVISRFPKTT